MANPGLLAGIGASGGSLFRTAKTLAINSLGTIRKNMTKDMWAVAGRKAMQGAVIGGAIGGTTAAIQGNDFWNGAWRGAVGGAAVGFGHEMLWNRMGGSAGWKAAWGGAAGVWKNDGAMRATAFGRNMVKTPQQLATQANIQSSASAAARTNMIIRPGQPTAGSGAIIRPGQGNSGGPIEVASGAAHRSREYSAGADMAPGRRRVEAWNQKIGGKFGGV